MTKKLNGFTSWIMVGLAVFAIFSGALVWAVRAEGKIEVNKVNINHVAA